MSIDISQLFCILAETQASNVSELTGANVLRTVAQQARETANKAHIAKAQELIALCMKEAEKGLFSYPGSGSINSVTKQALEQAGFKVETGSQYNESYFSISW